MGVCERHRRRVATAALLLAMVVPARTARAQEDALREVSRLFASANYEEALAALSRVDDPALLDRTDEYRALCLLALNRDAEAERAMELLVLRNPLPTSGVADRAPKFATMYRTVRGRLVPRLANGAYNAARDSFNAHDYAAATRQFDEALQLARSAENPAALRDLELLAAGFRTLAAARIEPLRLPAIPELAVTPSLGEAVLDAPPIAAVPLLAVLAPPPPPFAPVARIYGPDDRDVAPPVVIDQRMPSWSPPHKMFLQRSFTGQIRVLVGEDGRVLDAEITHPSFPLYDNELLRSAKQWRYSPALKADRAVQYRRVIEYVLNGTSQTAASR
jgi:tetratricopeptide (TPR) repeat protein